MNTAQVGSRVPDFQLAITRGDPSSHRRVGLADFQGEWLVLLFYPRDFSLVCPTELTAFSNRFDEFAQRGCAVVGVSTDSLATHDRWISMPRSQGGLGGLSFPLGSDEDGSVSQIFGVYLPRQNVALRGLFIIDPNGVLQYQVVHNLSVGRRTDEVLRVLAGLQSGGLCAENWTPEDANLDPTRTLAPGSVLGPFRLIEHLGSGSFGAVFKAHDTTLERTVALKILRPAGGDLIQRVLTEARLAAALNHPGLCQVYAVDQSEGVPLIAMEFVPGRTLEKVLKAGPPTAARARDIARQVAEGMAAAHAQGIVHGDLKPANLMVTPSGAVKVMDFGLARREHRQVSDVETLHLTASGKAAQGGGISGTPAYMSPEQTRGQPLTAASDVFSFGLLLFELVTGDRAITATSLLAALRAVEEIDGDALAARVPPPFDHVIRGALVQDPAKRITMAEVAQILANPTADIPPT